MEPLAPLLKTVIAVVDLPIVELVFGASVNVVAVKIQAAAVTRLPFIDVCGDDTTRVGAIIDCCVGNCRVDEDCAKGKCRPVRASSVADNITGVSFH